MLTLPDPCDTAFLKRSLGPRQERPQERRRFPRQTVASVAQLVPLTLDGPDFQRGMEARLQDISRGGASIILDSPPLGPHWAMVVPQAAGPLVMEIAIRDLRRTDEGPFRVACQFTRRIRTAG